MKIFLWILYTCLCLIDIVCAEKKWKRYAKGLLMPLLSFCYVLTCMDKGKEIHYLILIALFFGWIGDVALINKTSKTIKVGIMTFLLGHVFYIALFLQEFGGFFSLKTAGLLFYGVYTYFLVRKLIPHVNKGMVPITFVYLVIILCMSISAYFRYPTVTGISYYLTWIGTLSFLCSDSILSFQIYANGSHHGVMILYLIAQTLIVCSYLL